MSANQSQLAIHTVAGIIHVRLVQRKILDEVGVQKISDEIGGLIDGEARPRLVLDFSSVERLSSVMLGDLIRIYKKVMSKHGRLALASLAPSVQSVFAMTRLDTLFEIAETPEQAAANMA